MPKRSFVQKLSNRLNRRSSPSPGRGPESDKGADRTRKVRGKVELEGRSLVDGMARLSVSEDHSWSASWSSDHPWPEGHSQDTSVSPPSCVVRFEGITPTLEGVISDKSSERQGRFRLTVTGNNWPANDFE